MRRSAHYASPFGGQWQAYRRTQLDSYTGTTYSRDRLERCLGAPVQSLAGLSVLEVGCGAGRFTEWLLRGGAKVVAIDASAAVFANRENCAQIGDYALVMADINRSPLPDGSFDVVLCLGVVQHTPSPERTIGSLARHVKPGGRLVIDHYTWRSRWSWVGTKLTMAYPLRHILRRVARRRPDVALRATKVLTAICDPIRRRTCRVRALDRVVGRLFPTVCHYDVYTALPPDIVYAWNELDTHDTLTDWFKHHRTRDEIRAALERAGLHDVECWYDGNGVEARARA
jgi:SAM-dependent methyltransferase